MMQAVLIYAFAAAVLGGIDSPVGAVVGGLLLGVGLNLLGTYIDFVGADLRLPGSAPRDPRRACSCVPPASSASAEVKKV